MCTQYNSVAYLCSVVYVCVVVCGLCDTFSITARVCNTHYELFDNSNVCLMKRMYGYIHAHTHNTIVALHTHTHINTHTQTHTQHTQTNTHTTHTHKAANTPEQLIEFT